MFAEEMEPVKIFKNITILYLEGFIKIRHLRITKIKSSLTTMKHKYY
jgi:hypothetical protein